MPKQVQVDDPVPAQGPNSPLLCQATNAGAQAPAAAAAAGGGDASAAPILTAAPTDDDGIEEDAVMAEAEGECPPPVLCQATNAGAQAPPPPTTAADDDPIVTEAPTENDLIAEDAVIAEAEGECNHGTGKRNRGGQKKQTPKQKRAKLSDDDLIIQFDEKLEIAASHAFCQKKTGSGVSNKCSCLKLLRDSKYREPVARFMATMDRTPKEQVDQKICDWYRYANDSDNPSKTKWYFMPYDGRAAYDLGHDISKLRSAKMCTQSMMLVMDIGPSRFSKIRKAAISTGIVKPHGNKGRSTAMKDTDPRIPPLVDHFEELLLLGEVKATRLVSEMVDGMEMYSICPNTTEANDENVYLPSSDGY